jgi:Flp pilus assembly pilin Flp
MNKMLWKFITDDGGQDLIEYALLSALVGVVGVVAWANISAAIGNVYGRWDTNVQTISCCTPDPGGGGCAAPCP